MPTPSPATAASPLEAFNAPLHIGAVTLAVHDLDLMTTFYEQMLGLDVIEKSAARTTLGNDGMALVHLDHRPNATRENPKSAGLFHTAFLVPTRAGLGAWLLQASERKLQFTGMSDHQVSEALYLDDPEHNGIEVYVDRPRSAWVPEGDGVHMTTERLNTASLTADGRTFTGDAKRLPSGTRVGHVHLKVGGIAGAEQFYRDRLGLDIMHRRNGARFFGSGRYHHHIAGNTWFSDGSAPRAGDTTGLVGFELVARSDADFKAVSDHLVANGVTVATNADGLALSDPWNIAIAIRKPS